MIDDDAGPSPDQYETILGTIHDGVYTLDPAGHITWVNETIVTDFDIGYERSELVGSHVSLVLGDEDIDRCVELVRECLTSDRESGKCEVTLLGKNGREVPCELHLTVLPLDHGEFRGTVGVIREIAGRKRREQMLQVLNRVLRHNLRNEMNVILGRDELLEAPLDEDEAEHARIIRTTGESLIKLTEKIRWLSDLEELTTGHTVRVDIETRLRAIVANLETEYPSVDISFDLPERTEFHLRIGRVTVFDFVLTELLENSVIHNDRPTPDIDVAAEAESQWIRLTVTDNGPGLPSMERAVLERGSETPLEHGSGIGLWLVDWSLTTVRGDLSFSDNPGVGTTISLRFPRA